MTRSRRSSGFALLTVAVCLALMTVLLAAMFSIARTEREGAGAYHHQQRAALLADLSASLVVQQLRAAASGVDQPAGQPGFWAAQPGVVRRYSLDGGFVAARKLYSSAELVHRGSEAALLDDVAPPGWADQPHRWVDINQPVVRRRSDGTTTVSHPVIDPRAAVDEGSSAAVQGFSYQPTGAGGGAVDGVVAPGQASPDGLRLPLPVEWIYVLADGSLGTLDAGGVFRGPVTPADDNPIVGRIAYWADDETCKLPVNSASAPTYFAMPSVLHGGGPTAQDRWWARAPPATGEFQRFPGHPATTSLLPVLAPEADPGADGKGLLYEIVPKVAHVGTLAGTIELNADPVPWHAGQAAAERLYVTTDEFLLREDRQPNPLHLGLNGGGSWSPAAGARLLERSGFFLSAIGRAPDYTLHGTPRVAMWPVHARADGRTVFDQLIARCASLGGRPYHFQRERHDHATHDVGLPRNRILLDYLEDLAQRQAPGYAAALADKYPADSGRLVTSLFDYIRATNLYDARLEHDTLPNLSGADATYPRLLTHLPESPDEFRTYTPGRFAGRTQAGYHNLGFGLYPGHGQVIPSSRNGHMGFGRSYSLGEVSALFIACADGTANNVNPYHNSNAIADPWRGGFAVRRPVKDEADQSTMLYSNFPPNPQGQRYGADNSHPGYQPVNWNLALEPDTPLEPGVVRVQSTVLMDWFSVAGGYTILRGHFGVRVRGLSHLTLEGNALYPQDEVFIRPYWDPGDAYHNGYRGGGDGDVRGWLRQRKLPARGTRPADNGYNNPGAAGLPSDLRNYDLVSNYIDVEGETMEFGASGPVEIELLAPDAVPGDPPLQTFVIRFPDSSVLPRPQMVPTTNHGDPAQSNTGSFYWSFHADGFNGAGHTGRWDWRGRFWDLLHIPGGYGAIFRHHGDVIASMIPWHGDFRLTAGKPLVAGDPASPYEADGERWEFVPHDDWPQGGNRGGHNIMARHAHWWARYYHGPVQQRLFPGAWGGGFAFKFPNSPAAAAVSHRYGDFDNGPGNLPAGALINKPDEGDFYNRGDDTPYFSRNWMFDEYTPAYFSPNRMVSSPVMFGSLPVRVTDPDPWRTLLFRPQAPASYGSPHPGSAAQHGGVDPPDHVLLDWFRMPVVEPYAISDGASSGGKVNLNHQILPFSHVRRATALHGLLGDELIPKVNAANNGWHVPLDTGAVLEQIDDLLASGRLFTSVGQFCEIHLPPQPQSAHGDPAGFVNTSRPIADRMADFYSHYRGTADNLRERPYANLVPRIETRSNSWTVHCRVQVISRPRGADPARVVPDEVRVLSEYRGSKVIERFIDPDDPDLPDHAVQPSAPSLDQLHQFRIHSARRFAP